MAGGGEVFKCQSPSRQARSRKRWFWPARNYNLYRMRGPDGAPLAHRFDAVSAVVIEDDAVTYRDLALDWWVTADGALIEEDRDEFDELVREGRLTPPTPPPPGRRRASSSPATATSSTTSPSSNGSWPGPCLTLTSAWWLPILRAMWHYLRRMLSVFLIGFVIAFVLYLFVRFDADDVIVGMVIGAAAGLVLSIAVAFLERRFPDDTPAADDH